MLFWLVLKFIVAVRKRTDNAMRFMALIWIQKTWIQKTWVQKTWIQKKPATSSKDTE